MSMQLVPETDPAVLEEFCVADSVEILAYLKQLRDRKPLIAIHARGTDDQFVITELLAVDPGHQRIVFDFCTDEARRRAIVGAGRGTVVAYLDQVKVQFDAAEIAVSDFDGRPALVCTIPPVIHRLQRRETVRVHPPVTVPATCVLPPVDERSDAVRVRVLDIGAGGLSLLALAEDPQPQPGDLIEAALLELPQRAPLRCNLLVRSRGRGMLGSHGAHRIGCEFRGMDSTASGAVQVYVSEVAKATRSEVPPMLGEAGHGDGDGADANSGPRRAPATRAGDEPA